MSLNGNVLGKLFGSEARVRLLRLFLLNPNEVFELKAAIKRVRSGVSPVKRELASLLDIGYIKRGTKVMTIVHRGGKHVKKKVTGFSLDRGFPYINEIAELLASSSPMARERLSSGLRGVGKIGLVVIAGELVGQDRNQVDLFIVGDALKKSKIERALGLIEAEIGKELVYAIMTTKEFQYRYGMHDRFIKDLFDNPHELLVNKLGIG